MSADIHTLSGAYALDALDDAERAAFEEHLAGCASCQAEVDGLREAAIALAEIAPVTPPAHVRERLLASIATVRPLPPEPPVVVPFGRAGRTAARRWRLPTLLVAAALVVASLVWHPWTGESPDGVDRIIAAADVQRIEESVGSMTVTLYRSADLGRAALVAEDMPRLDDGKIYEIWLQDDTGTMQPAALVDSGAAVRRVLDGDAATATAAGITVEPAGGSAAPTSDPVALFAFSST
ncbi:MAG: anti-sigma factor [Nocardioides sp.]|uniref:anti-sigma factor n=1 Tax=Nocardioides sp. TaxID=35761 RepID=UPI0039E72A1E